MDTFVRLTMDTSGRTFLFMMSIAFNWLVLTGSLYGTAYFISKMVKAIVGWVKGRNK